MTKFEEELSRLLVSVSGISKGDSNTYAKENPELLLSLARKQIEEKDKWKAISSKLIKNEDSE